ncbi:flagellar hook-basal body complex protein FliE [Hoeflea sp. TYP-13]|uniref:flagellar hook-basal body complex protein FliE n=1 Tax=Hoeflea sp. TYP-13 TaxID=3230023 RepID=UPI0034C5D147
MIDAINTAAITSLSRQAAGSDVATEVAQPNAAAAAAAGTDSDFSSMLSDMVADMTTTIQRGEEMSVKGISGQATTQEVVEAVMSAERTLQTALAVRDKIVTAYLEISRMAI